MKQYIRYPRTEGNASRQAHADLPEGTYEREMGKEGFFGPASFFYHRHPPTAWTSFAGPLRPRAFDLTKLNDHSSDNALITSPWQAPIVLSNHHCEMRFVVLHASMEHLVRNADGDVLLFVHQGEGAFYCDFGHLSLTAGDYIVIPRGTMWRIESSAAALLMIEATNHSFTLPEKGMLGAHAVFDPALLEAPAMNEAFRAQQTEQPWQVHVKSRGHISTLTYPFNPLDATGWHGDLCVCKINVKDFRPVMSHRYHLPPSVHTTFVSEGFAVCTFVPRPFETDAGAIKVPFFHNNDDYDEVIFYHAGDFFSRDNIHPGMLTYHPRGFTHGPHPKALQRMLVQNKPMTDEVAVMIDSRDPLDVSEAASTVEWAAYVDSWKST